VIAIIGIGPLLQAIRAWVAGSARRPCRDLGAQVGLPPPQTRFCTASTRPSSSAQPPWTPGLRRIPRRSDALSQRVRSTLTGHST